jgi:hypothetical protein
MREDRGQATVEYLALVLLVGVVLGSAVALTSGGIGRAVEASIRRGICEVTSEQCPRLVAASIPSDLEACPLARKTGNQQLSLDIGIVRLAAQLGLTVEQMSDGKVRVSFADGGKAGLGVAVGAHVHLGQWGGKAEASADAGVAVTAGRVWVLPDPAAGERFIQRFGESQRLTGRVKNAIGSVCPLCRTVVGGTSGPPAPDERWYSGGLAVGSTAAIGMGPLSARLDATLRAALGRRMSKAGTTWFTRVDSRLLGSVDALGVGVEGLADANGVASLEIDPNGQLTRLKITREGRIASRMGMRLPVRLRKLLGDTRSAQGSAVESETVLELRTEADRDAALRFLGALSSLDPHAGHSAVASLRESVEANGQRTVRRWRLSRRAAGLGAGAALGVRLGMDASSSTDDQRLTSVASKVGQLGWLPRADCLAV